MATCKNKSQRGTNNPQNTEYANTVADYDASIISPDADNIIAGITCDSSVAVGNVVRMSGATVVNAQANNATNARAIGICVAKSDATTCDVQVTGFTNAVLAGLTVNENYFLSPSTAGALTTIAPSGSGQVIVLIGRPLTSQRMVIHIEIIAKRD